MRRITAQVGELQQVALPPDDVRAFAARLEWEASGEAPKHSRTRWFTPRRALWQQLTWCGALGFLLLISVKVWTPRPDSNVSRVARPRQAPPAIPQQLVASTTPAKRVRRAALRFVKRPAPPAAVAAKEVVTPFFPLPFSDAALPLDDASVIRVDLPRSALELTGLPVEEDRRNERIRADLVLGADGLARAIRFIR
jgi:hypothetical protein